MRAGGFICCVLLFLSGCIVPNTPGDLAFLSAQEVDWRDQMEMAGPGASPLRGLVPDRDLERMGESVRGGEKWHRPLIKVEFTSSTNLFRFAMANSYTVGSKAHFCSQLNQDMRLSFIDVYWRSNVVGWPGGNPEGEAAEGPMTYYIYLEVAREDRPRDIPPQKAFDLRRHPEDVCFYLKGGNMGGFGYKSNTVVVPKQAIAAALREGPPNAPR